MYVYIACTPAVVNVFCCVYFRWASWKSVEIPRLANIPTQPTGSVSRVKFRRYISYIHIVYILMVLQSVSQSLFHELLHTCFTLFCLQIWRHRFQSRHLGNPSFPCPMPRSKPSWKSSSLGPATYLWSPSKCWQQTCAPPMFLSFFISLISSLSLSLFFYVPRSSLEWPCLPGVSSVRWRKPSRFSCHCCSYERKAVQKFMCICYIHCVHYIASLLHIDDFILQKHRDKQRHTSTVSVYARRRKLPKLSSRSVQLRGGPGRFLRTVAWEPQTSNCLNSLRSLA